jgi:hypothetical protein
MKASGTVPGTETADSGTSKTLAPAGSDAAGGVGAPHWTRTYVSLAIELRTSL